MGKEQVWAQNAPVFFDRLLEAAAQEGGQGCPLVTPDNLSDIIAQLQKFVVKLLSPGTTRARKLDSAVEGYLRFWFVFRCLW